MTPREKAKELVGRFELIQCVPTYAHYGIDGHEGMDKEHAKQCALIAVEEIINSLGTSSILAGGMSYWIEVKQEIEKI